MRLLALAGQADSLIADIRLRTPLQRLCDQTGASLQVKSFHDCSPADLAAADVLIVQRGLSPRCWRLQRAMRQRGGAVVYEIDDLLTEVPAHISNHAAIQAAQPWLRRCLAESDLVTVSTARLGRALAVPAVAVVPNCAWPDRHLPLPQAVLGQSVHLLFASMESLAADFIVPALRALQSLPPPGVRLVAVGPAAASLAASGLAVQAQPLMPRERFIDFVRSLPNAVAVIPLEDSRFAACKSAIKWFEYANAGIPVLCSAVSPYAEVVQGGVTGELVPNDSEAWQAALQRAVADAAWRGRVAAAAQQQVHRHHALQGMVDAWRQALDLALQRRQRAVLPAPGLAERLQGAWWRMTDAPLRRLRQLNRARLGRRQSRGPAR